MDVVKCLAATLLMNAHMKRTVLNTARFVCEAMGVPRVCMSMLSHSNARQVHSTAHCMLTRPLKLS